MLSQVEGNALKNCEFTCGNLKRKGEAVLTKFGIEGSGIYPLSPEIRRQFFNKQAAEIQIDFKPELSKEELRKRFQNKGKQSVKDFLEKTLHLSSTQTALIKSATTKEEYQNIDSLIKHIKSFTIIIKDAAPLDDAISTVGGIDLSEVNSNLELIKLPNHYCLGEMLDWDAPTGGYLLQVCFSMGHFLAHYLNGLDSNLKTHSHIV